MDDFERYQVPKLVKTGTEKGRSFSNRRRYEAVRNNKYDKLTVADCFTDEATTTGLIDMFLEECATVLTRPKSIIKNSEKINLICVNTSFRTAELLWLYKSIETSTVFMEQTL